MNLFGHVNLNLFFGAEIRVIDGEEHICIPTRFNPSIVPYGGHRRVMFEILELDHPDNDGFTHICMPHLPKAIKRALPDADVIKMSNPVGRFKEYRMITAESVPPPKKSRMGYERLAANPVKEDEIPL